MQKEVYDFNRKMQQEIYYGFREKIESKIYQNEALTVHKLQIVYLCGVSASFCVFIK